MSQSDQMSNLFFHYMAIHHNKQYPKSIQKVPKYFQDSTKYKINPQTVAKLD